MDVIALVGPSGTGKSHRALIVARQNQADAIIDDGILIKDNRIVAGFSAKREASKIMAIKRAIFVVPGHAEAVRQAIAEVAPSRILILGTSENMVHKIAKALDLPPISRIINIADIASKAEIAKAQFYRNREGKHIIPVPTIELKPHFSGYLIDPIQSFFKKHSTKRRRLGEKSIVRPIFSYYGRLIIDDHTIHDIVKHIAALSEIDATVSKIKIRHIFEQKEDRGIKISIDLIVNYGVNIPTLIEALRKRVKKDIEYMTGMFIHDIDIIIKSLKFTEKVNPLNNK